MKITKKEYEKSLKKILSYVRKHPGYGSLDIGVKLKLRPELVLKALSQLKEDQLIEIRK